MSETSPNTTPERQEREFKDSLKADAQRIVRNSRKDTTPFHELHATPAVSVEGYSGMYRLREDWQDGDDEKHHDKRVILEVQDEFYDHDQGSFTLDIVGVATFHVHQSFDADGTTGGYEEAIVTEGVTLKRVSEILAGLERKPSPVATTALGGVATREVQPA